jgi:hypothetical protein
MGFERIYVLHAVFMRVLRQFRLEMRMGIAYSFSGFDQADTLTLQRNSPLSRQSWAAAQRVSAKSCLSAASSFGRAAAMFNFGNPKGGVAGAPFFAYFLWQDKESKLPPGNPRQA